MKTNKERIMTLNMLAIIMIAGFFILNLKINNIFHHLDEKIDRLDAKADSNFANLLIRIDALNARFDALYRDLFNKKAA
jgi:hypothetical protein